VERHIRLDGCFNFRDLGGYPAAGGGSVRWRTLFRSDAIHHLSVSEAAHLHDEIGLVTFIDLRTEREAAAGGKGSFERYTIHSFPLIEQLSAGDRNIVRERRDRSPDATARGYLEMLRKAGARIADALSLLTGEGGVPAVFYCAAGKDRTGVFAAAVLGALGVPDDTIVEDYLLTSQGIEAIIERLARSEVYASGIEGEPMEVFHPRADTMRMVLSEVSREFGSMAGYVGSLGVDVEHLRETLLE
jgi:protein tyrosine/serine phosphatase